MARGPEEAVPGDGGFAARPAAGKQPVMEQLNLFIAAQLDVDSPVGAAKAPRLSHSKWGGDRGEVMQLHAPPAPTHR